MNANKIFEDFLYKPTKISRGKKQCIKCGTEVGIRVKICECGHKFVKLTKKEKDAELDAATDEEKMYALCIGAPGGLIVYAARGGPPYDLHKISLDAVIDYCNLVVHQGIQDGRIYTVQAIKGYLKHQFGYNSEEYRQACEFVNLWYDEKMGVDSPSDYGIMGEDGDDPWA